MAEVINQAADMAEPLSEPTAGVVLNGHCMAPPPQDEDAKTWVRATALVAGTPAKLYALWRDIESSPIWQEMITDVIATGPKTFHWVMKDGENIIEWDSEILADEPGRRITWHSVAGDLNDSGEVQFDPAPGGRGTMVTVLQEFRQTKTATVSQTIFSRNPRQAVIENLRHFKAFAERGEIPRDKKKNVTKNVIDPWAAAA